MSKTKGCFAYNTKIIETPTTKEVYIYENPIFIHSKEKADLTDTSNRKKFDEMSALQILFCYQSCSQQYGQYPNEPVRNASACVLNCHIAYELTLSCYFL